MMRRRNAHRPWLILVQAVVIASVITACANETTVAPVARTVSIAPSVADGGVAGGLCNVAPYPGGTSGDNSPSWNSSGATGWARVLVHNQSCDCVYGYYGPGAGFQTGQSMNASCSSGGSLMYLDGAPANYVCVGPTYLESRCFSGTGYTPIHEYTGRISMLVRPKILPVKRFIIRSRAAVLGDRG